MTCFTSTKVQILTSEAQLDKTHWSEALNKSPVMITAVAEWLENWRMQRNDFNDSTSPEMRVVKRWERIMRPIRRRYLQTNYTKAYRWRQAIKAMKIVMDPHDRNTQTKEHSAANAVIESGAPHDESSKECLPLEAGAEGGPKGIMRTYSICFTSTNYKY